MKALTREQVLDYWRRMYRPENAVLAVAGSYDWNAIVGLAQEFLGSWEKGSFLRPEFHTNLVEPTFLRREKDIEQANICLGFPGLATGDEMGYECSLFSSVYGGAMSSRLFQKIREEKGLAYSVYSYPNAYTDCGMLSVYAATNPENAQDVCDMIREETARLVRDGLTREEFTKAREQLKSGFILGQESTSARMHAMGRRMLLLGGTRSEDEVIARVNAMDYDRTNQLMRRLLGAKPSCAVVSRGADQMQLI